MSAAAAIAAEGLRVGYRRRGGRSEVTLDNVEAHLSPGQLTFLLGPNGAGKSTLLRTLVGSQKPLAGRVLLAGDDLARLSARERAKRLSVVLTDPIDVGLMTVRGLVGLGRSPHVGWFSVLAEDDRQTVDWALDVAGASRLAERQVIELSDGERQRAMIARALAQKPSVLVLDEPTAFLDLTRRVELIALLRTLASDTGLAVLMSTHDLDLALRTADQLWLVHADGRFETGGPEDLAMGGSIARAYAGRDIGFDHAAGTFVLTGKGRGPEIAVAATGPALHWAQRAVQRAGFVPVPPAARAAWQLAVEHCESEGLDWRLEAAGTWHRGRSFSALVGQLAAFAEQDQLNQGTNEDDETGIWPGNAGPADRRAGNGA
jgi:iron complex transport system ATP-binding protein